MASALIGLFILRPLIIGRRIADDPVLFSVSAASAILVTALLYLFDRAALRDSDPAVGYSIAVIVGLASFLPAHALLWILYFGVHG